MKWKLSWEAFFAEKIDVIDEALDLKKKIAAVPATYFFIQLTLGNMQKYLFHTFAFIHV